MKRLFRILFLSLILTGFIYSIYYLFSLLSESSHEEFFSEKKENIEFGFNLDNYQVDRDTIQFGDSFGEIMLRNKLSYSQVYNITQSIKDSFDVRWLTAGKPYIIVRLNAVVSYMMEEPFFRDFLLSS